MIIGGVTNHLTNSVVATVVQVHYLIWQVMAMMLVCLYLPRLTERSREPLVHFLDHHVQYQAHQSTDREQSERGTAADVAEQQPRNETTQRHSHTLEHSSDKALELANGVER